MTRSFWAATLVLIFACSRVNSSIGLPSLTEWPQAGGETRAFTYLTYSVMVKRLQQLAVDHPDIIEVFSAQERYKLPAKGSCGGEMCQQWVAVVGNRKLRAPHTPEVFLSGALHGDETIGPASVLETVTFLVERYGEDPWVTQLVDTRTVVAMPMANAEGGAKKRREENGVDTNRDFAFDTDPDQCMKTTAARAINEVYREHIFQLGVTFHGGDNLIGYPWGDRTHCQDRSGRPTSKMQCDTGYVAPDKKPMHSLGERLVNVAGDFGGSGLYRLGEMNKVIYAVNGGMEDWAYGGSWHKAKVTCTPGDDYPAARTVYEDPTLRSVLFLVETANSKQPHVKQLGDTRSVLQPGAVGDGHVPRNLRLSLAVIEAVEPFVLFFGTPTVAAASVANSLTLDVNWTVGGTQTVESVRVVCPPSVACIYEESASPSAPVPWVLGTRSGRVTVTWGAGPAPASVELRLAVKVDGDWKVLGSLGAPESHWVRARANLDGPYLAAAAGHEVRGRMEWSSPPVIVVPAPSSSENKSGKIVSEGVGPAPVAFKGTNLEPVALRREEASNRDTIEPASMGTSNGRPQVREGSSVHHPRLVRSGEVAGSASELDAVDHEGANRGQIEVEPGLHTHHSLGNGEEDEISSDLSLPIQGRDESAGAHTLIYAAVWCSTCVLLGLLYFRKRRLGLSKKWDGKPVWAPA